MARRGPRLPYRGRAATKPEASGYHSAPAKGVGTLPPLADRQSSVIVGLTKCASKICVMASRNCHSAPAKAVGRLPVSELRVSRHRPRLSSWLWRLIMASPVNFRKQDTARFLPLICQKSFRQWHMAFSVLCCLLFRFCPLRRCFASIAPTRTDTDSSTPAPTFGAPPSQPISLVQGISLGRAIQ